MFEIEKFFGKDVFNFLNADIGESFKNAFNEKIDDNFDLSNFKYDLNEDIFKASFKIPKEIPFNNISINIDSEKNEFKLSYSYKDENKNYNTNISENLPSNLDINTIEATFENGYINVIAKTLKEISDEPKKININFN